MTFNTTKLEGCFIIEPKVIQDERGFFMEISMPKRDGVQRKFILCKTINRSQAKEY
jgi:dTDP-4-dehydrorhamnose 3,5-epimerase-like enzyme